MKAFLPTFAASQKSNRMRLRWWITALLAGLPFLAISAQEKPGCMTLSIEEMFSLADRNNSGIRSYEFARSAAAEAVKAARNDRLPSLDFSVSASLLGDGWLTDRNFKNGMKAPIPRLGNNFAVEAAQVVYAGGAISSRIALAELKQEAVQWEAEENRQDIRFLLAGYYLELYKLDHQAEVYRQNIDRTRRLLTDIRVRQQEGLAIRNDITRYDLQLQRLELALTQTENSRAVVNDRLATLLGLDTAVRIEPDKTVTDVLPVVPAESEWQLLAANAPELHRARLGVEQSRQGERLARSERIPSFSLFAGDKLEGPILVEVPPLNQNLNYWYAGVGMKYNIASLYKSGRNIRQARYVSRQAEALEQQAKETVQSAVKEAYIRLDESFAVWQMQEKNLELATQNYEVVRFRFLNDLALLTDMLDADNEKLAAELDAANAKANILFHYYRLQKVSGNL